MGSLTSTGVTASQSELVAVRAPVEWIYFRAPRLTKRSHVRWPPEGMVEGGVRCVGEVRGRWRVHWWRILMWQQGFGAWAGVIVLRFSTSTAATAVVAAVIFIATAAVITEIETPQWIWNEWIERFDWWVAIDRSEMSVSKVHVHSYCQRCVAPMLHCLESAASNWGGRNRKFHSSLNHPTKK